MDRIKNYFVYLLIPAVPYLLMIFRPDLIDPVYQYLANGKGHQFVWVLLISLLLWGVHSGVTFDFKSSNVKNNFISFTKWYFVLIALLASSYIFLFKTVSFKYLILGVMFSVIAYYMFAIKFGKKHA